MDRITFTVNDEKYSVGSEIDSDVSLNDYLRNFLNLRGTKYMCKEGGCGACIVSVTAPHQNTFSVNSCLVSVTSCQDWNIRTIEGLGDRRKGYHPLQRALAEYNGTQCGYCSPGWIMSMYSLLESNNYDLTQYQIEDSFGSNTCRCTGYRPILDSFKSFAKDAPKPNIIDIEDLKLCSKDRTECKNDWCFVEKSDVDTTMKVIHLKDNRIWYKVKNIQSVFEIFGKEGTESYMLVNGNTGRGTVPIFEFPRVLIDISQIEDLKRYYIDQNLVIGAGTTLTELMNLFKVISEKHTDFVYLKKLNEHLNLVAHIPVRNIGTIGGNLMVKHQNPTFSSDIFLLFECVGAYLTLVSVSQVTQVSIEKFLTLDMTGKIITEIILPPLSSKFQFVSFKIMPRSQNAHAQVNAAYLYKFDSKKSDPKVLSARIVYGGLSGEFVHAKITEKFLIGRNIFSNETLQQAIEVLNNELIVEEIAGELKPEYRKKCALGLFYKGLLQLIPENKLNPRFRSGVIDYRRNRPLSKGTEVYDTNPSIWPVTEPMPKLEALIQCAGEAMYVNDLPTQPKEVFCAFVTSDVCTGQIKSIDPSPALKLPGVLAFLSIKDLPGLNSFIIPDILTTPIPEEIFAENKVKYYDQAIGVIVAESEKIANRAALLVHIKYNADTKMPILKIPEAKERDPSRVSLFIAIPPKGPLGPDIQKIIKSTDNMTGQYHFTMETLSTVTRPTDDGLEVNASTQWLDIIHVAMSKALNLEQSRINVIVPRCGGAFGIKLTRASHVAIASALVTYQLNRTCRFVMSIQANMRVMGKRPPCSRDYEVAVNSQGEIQYITYNFYEDNGFVMSEALVGLVVAAIKNCYDSTRWQINIFNVITDNPHNTYARSPGPFEATAMAEILMERISYETNRDPIEVRLNNLERKNTDVAEMVQTLIKDGEYERRKKNVDNFNSRNRWKKRGLRVAMLSWPVSSIMNYHVLLSVYHGDATVMIKHGGVEMGQGVNTRLTQTVAYTLNIPMRKIKVKPSDTESNPNSFAAGGSRFTQSVCFGAIKCCQILLDRLSVVRETLTDPTWGLLIETAYQRGINLQTSYLVTSNDQLVYRAGGVAFAEVELDILTGEHQVLRVDIIQDVGTSLNPELDIGQVEGGFIFGMGYWTHEHLIYDEKTGELLTDRTWTYKVPLAKDVPLDLRVQLRRNSYNPVGTLGAKSVSEPPTCLGISVAFALRAAIAASREESGFPKNQWFNVDGPFTLEANVLSAAVKLEEFKFY